MSQRPAAHQLTCLRVFRVAGIGIVSKGNRNALARLRRSMTEWLRLPKSVGKDIVFDFMLQWPGQDEQRHHTDARKGGFGAVLCVDASGCESTQIAG